MRAIVIWLCIRDWLLPYWSFHIGWRPSQTWVMSSEGQRVPSWCNIDLEDRVYSLDTDVEIIYSMVSYEDESKVQKCWYMDIKAFMRRFLKNEADVFLILRPIRMNLKIEAIWDWYPFIFIMYSKTYTFPRLQFRVFRDQDFLNPAHLWGSLIYNCKPQVCL